MNVQDIVERYTSVFQLVFRFHDAIADMLAKRYVLVKKGLLGVSWFVLFLIFIPEAISFRRDFGEQAANLLVGILFISPISVIVRTKLTLLLMGLRRQIGILMGCLALTHGALFFMDPLFFEQELARYWGQQFFDIDRSILAGILGMILILPLLITSNTLSVRFIGSKNWKRLHWLVYPAFIAIVLHRFFRVGGSWNHIQPFIESSLLIGSYGVLKYVAWKPSAFPRVRQALAVIGDSYQGYRQEKHL